VGPGTSLTETYHPIYSATFLIENWRQYLGFMIYSNDPVPFAVLALVPAITIALRSKVLIVSSALILIGSLPVLFVDQRGLSMLYIPMTGWAIFPAALLAWSRERITSVVGHRAAGQTALFVCAAALLCIAHHRDRPDHTFPRPGRVEFIQPFLD
jgi:hypothetical protein